jgi:hypothetical protein
LGWSQETYILAVDYTEKNTEKKYHRILAEKKPESARLLNDPLRNSETSHQESSNDDQTKDDTADQSSEDSTEVEDVDNEHIISRDHPVIPEPANYSNEEVDEDPYSNEKCLQAAKELQIIPHDIKIMRNNSKRSSMYYNDLAQLRSGFYCLLCDAEFNSIHSFNWESQSNQKTFIFGQQFCNQFIDKNFLHISYMNENFKKYVNYSITLLECQKRIKGDMSNTKAPIAKFEYTTEEDEAYKKCKDGRLANDQSLFSCERVCKSFDLTSISQFIDGNIAQMNKIVNYFNANKIYFQYPTNNFMVEDPDYTVSLLNDNFIKSVSRRNFFYTGDKANDLDVSNTQIIQADGPDIYKIIEGNRFPLSIENQMILALNMISVIFALIL